MYGRIENKNSSDDSDGNDASFELYNQSNEEEITKNWRKDQITKKQELYSMNNNQIKNTDFIVPSSYILKTMKKKEEKQK
jgi:hypothetical protein